MEDIKAKISDSESPENDVSEYGFFVQKGKYIARTFTRDNKPIDNEISNFTMKSLFHLVNGSNNSQRIIYLQRNTGECHLIEIYSAEMKPESFEIILKSKRCTFYGTAYQLKKVFGRMMDEEQEAFILNELGWNPVHKIFVYADAIFTSQNKILIIDETGIIKDQDKSYYLPAFGFANLNNDDFKTEKLYKYLPGNTNFEHWSKLYYEAFGENGVIGILFVILSLFRDIVFDNVGFFPFLFLFGDFGTGKTSFTERMLSLFGRDTIGTPLNNATTIALSRLASSRSNEIFYFKEYTNETDETAEDFILTAYDGAGRTTGIKSNDNRTKSLPIKSAMIFDGNHLPTAKSAILSRMILLNFEKQKFEEKEKTAFNKLKQLSDEGLGLVLTEILSNREKFKENFKSTFRVTAEKIKDKGHDLPERSINHMSLLYTAFESLFKELTFPFDNTEVKTIIHKITNEQGYILEESGTLNIFWSAIDFQIKKGQIIAFNSGYEGSEKQAHYRLKTLPEDRCILQIRLQSIYPFYVKYCRENNMMIIDQSSIRMLLTSTSNKTFIPSQQKSRSLANRDKIFGSCHEFILTKTESGYKIGEIDLSV